MTLLVDLAGLATSALARDLLPPDKSITRTAGRRLLHIIGYPWQDRKALGQPMEVSRETSTPSKRPASPAPAGPTTMYDAVITTNIPANATAVAGYINGHYRTVDELRARFPHARLLTIAVTTNADADCLDIENGDATPAQAPAWVRRQHARGLKRPCLYANRSTMPAVWAALKTAGIARDQVRLWVADWTGQPHIPRPYDACQWHGGATVAYDQSLCLADFFG